MVVVVYLDYSVSSGPFLKFSMRFEFLSEILYYSVCEICEIRDPSLTINVRFLLVDRSLLNAFLYSFSGEIIS